MSLPAVSVDPEDAIDRTEAGYRIQGESGGDDPGQQSTRSVPLTESRYRDDGQYERQHTPRETVHATDVTGYSHR